MLFRDVLILSLARVAITLLYALALGAYLPRRFAAWIRNFPSASMAAGAPGSPGTAGRRPSGPGQAYRLRKR